MPVVIGVDEGTPDVWREPEVILHLEVLDYLQLLQRSTARVRLGLLATLGDVDPYGLTRFSLEDAKLLLAKSEELKRLALAKHLPTPPAYIALEEEPEPGEAFGWRGLLVLAGSLRKVCGAALEERKGLVAVGD